MEESDSKVRRSTRAAKAAPASVKASRAAKNAQKAEAKPTTRKTRKKVVLMEVEVSDDEEENENVVESSGDDKAEKELEDKLLASPEPSNDTGDEKIGESPEKTNLNGDNTPSTEKVALDDSFSVVYNDIEIIKKDEEDKSKNEEKADEKESNNVAKTDDKELSNVKENKEKASIAEETKATSKKTETPADPPKTETESPKTALSSPKTAAESPKPTESPKSAVESPKPVVESPKSATQSPKKIKVAKPSEDEEAKAPEVKESPSKKESEPEDKSKLVVELAKTSQTEDKIEEKMEVDEEPEVKKEDTPTKMDVDEVEAKETSTELTKDVEEKKLKESKVEKEESTEKSSEKKDGGKVSKKDDEAEKKDGEKVDKKDEDNEDEKEKIVADKQNGDPDAENISEDELPGVPVVKVPEAEEVSDEELPGPKRAELPADTEVVSEDELPNVKSEAKKEGVKRKLNETDDYDPGSPTSESEVPAKKPSLEKEATDKEEKPKPEKPKKLPELDKYWKAVNDDPTDFTGWTYLLQYVDQENDMEAAREAYDAFLSHYPYCYGYWRKYADYEKRKGNKKKCEEVFERGLKAIPLSVDLWIHYLTYVKTTRTDEEVFIRSQFERALTACGLEFRSDRLWDSYIKWETEGKRLQKVTAIYDRLLATPTQGYTSHFDNFQEHVATNPPNKVIDVDEFLALRKEVRNTLKHDAPQESADSDAPPGDEDQSKIISSDEETKSIRERIVSIRRKIHKGTVNAVTARWNYEEGIKRPYFHVKPLERCQLKNWHDYLDYETEQGDKVRIIVLFERCLIACALYEEFWLKFVHYLESLKDPEYQPKIRDVYERACTIHHLKKPNLHLQWAMFEENIENPNRAAEILVNLEKTVPNVLQIAYRRINLERRRKDYEKCAQLYEHYISNSKNKMISSNIAIKYSRFCFRILKDLAKAQEILKGAITKDPNNPRLYLQLIDLTLQKEEVEESDVIGIIDSFLDKETTDADQKTLFAQRKLEYLEDFGADLQSVQMAYENYQKLLKQSKENNKKKEVKSEATSVATKKEKPSTQSSSQSGTYTNYGQYGSTPNQPPYGYSGQQGQYNYSQYGQNEQYQYQNWQYPQGGYGGYNQWGGYGGGYGY